MFFQKKIDSRESDRGNGGEEGWKGGEMRCWRGKEDGGVNIQEEKKMLRRRRGKKRGWQVGIEENKDGRQGKRGK